jgi:uncharacterized protein YkwD
VAAIAIVLIASSIVGGRTTAGDPPTRAVLSSLAPGERELSLSTSSLYAKNDPWLAYLASESVCPGGERTDLPVALQVATVACLVNFARKRRGLRPLVVVPLLNGASVRKARAIVRCETFAHNPCGEDWTSAARAAGYGGVFGENLYVASGRWGAPRVAVDAWLNSDPHRENLFGREWREQGLAVLPGKSFGVYRDVALWVNVLGDR